MILVFLSETATGRPGQRAQAIEEAASGTRLFYLCGQPSVDLDTPTPAGRLMVNLMEAPTQGPYVEGSEFRPLRHTDNVDTLATTLRDYGAQLNSRRFPTGPQATSLVIIGATPFIWDLARHFGATVDPSALVPAVIDVQVEVSAPSSFEPFRCPAGHVNPKSAHFCVSCGQPLWLA